MIYVFRWKGENVATTEVTEVLGMVDFIQEANVYGVEIPGTGVLSLCVCVCVYVYMFVSMCGVRVCLCVIPFSKIQRSHCYASASAVTLWWHERPCVCGIIVPI